LLAKPGLPPHVTQAYAEEVFWLAIDPGTYRSLTGGAAGPILGGGVRVSAVRWGA
jgi:hypothetical protein